MKRWTLLLAATAALVGGLIACPVRPRRRLRLSRLLRRLHQRRRRRRRQRRRRAVSLGQGTKRRPHLRHRRSRNLRRAFTQWKRRERRDQGRARRDVEDCTSKGRVEVVHIRLRRQLYGDCRYQTKCGHLWWIQMFRLVVFANDAAKVHRHETRLRVPSRWRERHRDR